MRTGKHKQTKKITVQNKTKKQTTLNSLRYGHLQLV